MHQVKIAHFRLAHSCKCFVVAFSTEIQEKVMDTHQCVFHFLGGIPKRITKNHSKMEEYFLKCNYKTKIYEKIVHFINK